MMPLRERKSKADKTSTSTPEVPTVTTTGPTEDEAGGVLTVDLSAIQANWRALARRVSPAECSAVVKADAYGCGIEPVVRALHNAGCKTFFVAHVTEARRVRAVAPEAIVYVLNGIVPGSASAFAASAASVSRTSRSSSSTAFA